MKKLQLFSIPILLAGIIFSACQKKTEPQTQSKSEMLTSSSWKFDKATAGGIDISSAPQLACFKDNIITFTSNGSGTIDEGPVVCTPPSSASFTWTLQNNDTDLSLSTALIPGGSSTFRIVTLNQANLVISQDVNLPPTTTIVITLKH